MENIKEKKFKIAKENLEKVINELQKEYGIEEYDTNHYQEWWEVENPTNTNMSEEEKHKIASEAMDILFNEK